jgi:SAM-dependent methyltransferase
MTHRHPLAFLIGVEGHALLRAYAGEFDADFAEARVAELREILAAHDRGGLGFSGDEVGEIDTVTGYRDWSTSYDEPVNPLIDLDEPIVRRILAGLPPGDAVDVCCGTGRFAAILDAAGHQVTGVDSSPEMLAVARPKAPGATFVIGDARALPVPDGSANLVTCRPSDYLTAALAAGFRVRESRTEVAGQPVPGWRIPALVGGRRGRRRLREHAGRDRLEARIVREVAPNKSLTCANIRLLAYVQQAGRRFTAPSITLVAP